MSVLAPVVWGRGFVPVEEGTVTTVSVTTANGVSGVVANATTTPAITLTLGAITPTTVRGLTITTTNGTLTLVNGSSIVTAGAFAITLTSTGTTGVTLPTTGTLATRAGSEALTNKTLGAWNYAADAGSTDDYVITLSPAPAAYTTGMIVYFKAATANTGAASLNVNALGVKTIVKRVNTTLADNDILANMFCAVIYDGTNFVLLNPIVN